MLIRDAEVVGAGRVDVRLGDARVFELGASLARRHGEPVLDARGGALLPGLHDHHIHLFALAASLGSVDCGPPTLNDAEALGRALARAAAEGRGWLRGVAYHECVAGPLTRERLDAWVPKRPVRVQHRSGALWMLNSAALEALAVEAGDAPEGLERDADGRPTGRLFRGDTWLRARLGGEAPDLAEVGAQLAARGMTGLTDAGVGNDAAALATLGAAVESGALPQRLWVMGRLELPEPPAAWSRRVARGPVKAILDEARLPPLEELVATARAAHAAGRALAVHCATRTELFFALAALGEAGVRDGDRLEHASVAPPEAVAAVAALGLRVVTQPHFVAERGEQYLADVAPEDLPFLYRGRAWLDAGVALAAGSDAPYGAPDPWASMRAAVGRHSRGGAVLGADEALSPEAALGLFTTPPEDPGGAPRRVAPGAPSDLCLLERPWREARGRLRAEDVAACFCAGRLAFAR